MMRIGCGLGIFVVLACEPVAVGRLAPPSAEAVEVRIETEPPGVTLSVDGTPVGASPQRIRLNPGAHVIKGTQSGYFAAEHRLHVARGQNAETVRLTLVASH